IFDAAGHDVLHRTASPQVRRIVESMRDAPGWTQRVDAGERIIAEKSVDALGNPYVVVVDFPGPSILARSLFEFLSSDFNGGRLTRTLVGRLAAVLIVAGMFCFVL